MLPQPRRVGDHGQIHRGLPPHGCIAQVVAFQPDFTQLPVRTGVLAQLAQALDQGVVT